MKIILNDRVRDINMKRMAYSAIVIYGMLDHPGAQSKDFTISYLEPGEGKNIISMQPRSSVALKEGMIIEAKPRPRTEIIPNSDKNGSGPAIRVKVKPEAIERRKQELIQRGAPYTEAEKEFLHRNGHTINKAVLQWPSNMTPEQQEAEIQRVKELMAPHEARYQEQLRQKELELPPLPKLDEIEMGIIRFALRKMVENKDTYYTIASTILEKL